MGLLGSRPTHRVAVFGLDSSGRSTLVYALAAPGGGDVTTVIPVIACFAEKCVAGDMEVRALQWSPQLSTPMALGFLENEYKDATCVVLIVDAADPRRLTEKTGWNSCVLPVCQSHIPTPTHATGTAHHSPPPPHRRALTHPPPPPTHRMQGP
jgi:hypothetical protein